MGKKKAERVMKKRKLSGPITGGVTSRKQGPVVRVVQDFAPLIVQADESNFRSLVQKLTGQQSAATATSQAGSSPPPPSSSEDQDHQLVKTQPYIQTRITSSALSCSVPSNYLSHHTINNCQHALHHHSDHFSFSLINDAACLSSPTYTSSAGSFYHAESYDLDDDDTPFFDFFDYHHLIDLPALPQVLDQEAERWLECTFSNTCLDQN